MLTMTIYLFHYVYSGLCKDIYGCFELGIYYQLGWGHLSLKHSLQNSVFVATILGVTIDVSMIKLILYVEMNKKGLGKFLSVTHL